jgi:DNA-binding IclR family transcriptional regulator
MSDKRHLSSLRRGLSALSLLNYHGRVTTTQLARHCGVPRTTAHRILATLVDEGYVVHNEASHCYSLSSQVRRLASGFSRDGLVSEAGRPVLQRLCKQFMMPSGLTTPVGGDMVLQVSTDFEAPLALGRVPEGTAFPATYGPSGHVYLAHCGVEQRRQIVALAALSSGSFVSLYRPPLPTDDLLDIILDRGYAVGLGAEPGCREGLIAVPVLFNGAYIASLTLRFMNRVHSVGTILERHLPVLRSAAEEIEDELNRRSRDQGDLDRAEAAPPPLVHRSAATATTP